MRMLALFLMLALPTLAITWSRHEVSPGVSAEFPGKPVEKDGLLVYHNGGDRLTIGVIDQDLTAAQALQNLESNMRLYAADHDGEITSQTKITRGGFLGYRFKVSRAGGAIDAVWVADGKLWLMAAGEHKGARSEVTEHFLDSLRYGQ